MDDFIFGTLATEEQRLALLRLRREGVTHIQARQPRDPLPGQPVTVELTVGPAHPCEQAWVYWTNDGSDPLGEKGIPVQGQALPMQPIGAEWDTYLWGYVRRFRAEISGQAPGTVVRYRLAAGLEGGAEILADDGAYYGYYVDDDPTPAWTRQAVIYQIFVDRFFPGDGKAWRTPKDPRGFYGGTLPGITQKLDYIAGLGANALWLSPIFPSPSHHGYDSTDYFAIEPRLGTKADLGALLEAAHARGIRVLLDFVPNHWSHLHPTFQSAISDPDSPYQQWYHFAHWPDRYSTFFGVRSLPQLNLRHPEARQHMLDAAAYWLEFGVDGYRVDYGLGPPPDFWADFRRVTRQARPDCWTFGEMVGPPDTQLTYEGALDGCLDFTLLEAFRQAFAFGRWNAERLGSFLLRHEAYFPATFSRPSFLDNHDMNRFLWACGGDQRRLRLAAFCQFTLPGAPIIYYGTEAGLSQARDVRQDGHGRPEESRLPMLWNAQQDKELLAYYQQLIALRRYTPALCSANTRLFHAAGNTIVYIRGDGDEAVYVALNLSESAGQVEFVMDRQMFMIFGTPHTLAANIQQAGESVMLLLPPLSGLLLKGM